MILWVELVKELVIVVELFFFCLLVMPIVEVKLNKNKWHPECRLKIKQDTKKLFNVKIVKYNLTILKVRPFNSNPIQ